MSLALQKHPDRFRATWWPVRIGRWITARVACPKCGDEIVVKRTVNRIGASGGVEGYLMCERGLCWMGRVTLMGWAE